ncbi:hypothetical protein JTB14_016322 [Gonioctena quinquepunctata]|nr:hypothetical protein JTB14_016322 [Gonioctena quinquepunctata]
MTIARRKFYQFVFQTILAQRRRNQKIRLQETAVLLQQPGKFLMEPPNSKEKNSNELNTFFINIRSLRNKLEELELFIDNEKLDIICLCEHWLHQDIIKYYGIENFSLVNNYCRTQSNHGGVMIYVNSKFKTKKLPIIDSLSVDIHCEVIAIEVKTINIIVLCMYRSPSGDPGIFLQKLNHILNVLLKTHKPIFIYGDFNINIKDNCNLTNEFCDTVSSFGCELLVYESTRITQNSETCIDNCITNVRKASEITLVNCYMSDHIGLKNKYTLDSKFKIKGETCIIEFRPMSDEAIKKCIYLLKQYKWDHL